MDRSYGYAHLAASKAFWIGTFATLAVAVAALVVAFARPAVADVSEAKERFKKGVELFQDADYEGALVEFKAAYEAAPNYKVKYNIGTSLTKLHRYVEAKKELEAYLEEGGEDISDKDRLTVQGILYEIQSLIGSITVICNVKGASVLVNDADAGPCPFASPLDVDLGEHDVEVVAEGYKPFKKTVTVPGGKAIIVDATLEAVAQPAPTPAPVVIAAPPVVVAPDPTMGLLTVEVKPGFPGSFEVHVDGEMLGRTPLAGVEVEPGDHNVAVMGSKYVTSHYETVHVEAGQSVHVLAKMKRVVSRNLILFGMTWLVAGGVASIVCGVLYKQTDPAETDKRFSYKVLTISFGAIAGVGLVLAPLGIALFTSYLKKDARLKAEYLSAPVGELSLSPFASPVAGGGVLGVMGVF